MRPFGSIPQLVNHITKLGPLPHIYLKMDGLRKWIQHAHNSRGSQRPRRYRSSGEDTDTSPTLDALAKLDCNWQSWPPISHQVTSIRKVLGTMMIMRIFTRSESGHHIRRWYTLLRLIFPRMWPVLLTITTQVVWRGLSTSNSVFFVRNSCQPSFTLSAISFLISLIVSAALKAY